MNEKMVTIGILVLAILLAAWRSPVSVAQEVRQTVDLGEILDQVSNLEKRVETVQSVHTQTVQSHTKERAQYERIINQAAHRICCKEKVDRPNVNSYEIVQERIFCSNEGSKTLEC